MYFAVSIGSLLRKVYEEKVAGVPEERHLNNIGYGGSIPYILQDSSIAFIEYEPYLKMDEWPCQITNIKEMQ